jgi:carbamoyl-phosphate synthase large subunit
MTKIRNVLVFPGGTEIGLEIHAALKHCKDINLIGAGSDNLNHGAFVFENYHILPTIYEDNWLPELVDFCKLYLIDYIFPAYDDVIVALANFRDKIPAAILLPSTETCLITRSKRLTYEKLKNVINVPFVFNENPEDKFYPVILKPDKGQGSQNVRLIKSLEDLFFAKKEVKDCIVCEYLPGAEYTIDCFSDREKGLLFYGARERRRTKSGISINTIPVRLDGIYEIAYAINNELKMYGAWFFQVKYSSLNELVLLEVAPRIAGSMSLHRVLGINFALLSIFEYERKNIEILVNSNLVELDRPLENRYHHNISFSHVYVDLDDTLILKNKINLDIIKFIFKSKNSGCKVILLTRHKNNLNQTLKHFSLLSVFDDIFHITDGSNKSDYIAHKNSIFIDDSFSERIDVHKKIGIPTFDSSMIELLN